jgi:predicted transcriptional regulator
MMRKLVHVLLLILTFGSIMLFSARTEAATLHKVPNGKEDQNITSKDLKILQVEVKNLNKKKDELNKQINSIYPKKKKKLINQLKELEKSDAKNKQAKLDNIQKQIDLYKKAISTNNELNNKRKKLWQKYKTLKEDGNFNGMYQTLRQIRTNLEKTIKNNQDFLANLLNK